MLEQPDPLGVHAGRRQIHDFGDAFLAVGAGGLDVGQIDVRAHMHAERVGDAVHHLAHTEASGARAEVEHAHAYDHTGLGGDARVGDRLVPVALDVFHVERDRVRMESAHRPGRRLHGPGTPVHACAVPVMTMHVVGGGCRFFFALAHISTSTTPARTFAMAAAKDAISHSDRPCPNVTNVSHARTYNTNATLLNTGCGLATIGAKNCGGAAEDR